ncbi:MAG: bifunctional [glutamate--ammonia ligase]-adenylyl-L-tyrosine phosphorylase/[glutamate--ammonia-ligase] adenylyltransferase [Lautropia sp.]|nr:bifunctional [glutamate--ammonia ligase]-adenylyl-L-tyrosine phosphorylase/[glutamate--ammonia-ligase] adenylyltransferase [Lautropia sp.]
MNTTPAPYQAEAHSAYFRRSWQAVQARGQHDEAASLAALVAAPLAPVAIDAAWQRQLALGQAPEVALRRFRTLLMMAIIERDISGQAPLEEVLAAITHWATRSVQHALDVGAAELQAQGRTLLDMRGQPQDLLVVGMGKLGGGELNVSSDIDLIYVARDQGEDHRYLERIARRISQLLSAVTADGFVFRVDTRLRPYGDAGPLIATLPALGSYFHEQGREWERFAWLKGRVIAHTGLAPQEATRQDEQKLMQQVVPFVFRHYLDFPAFASLARLHEMIRAEAAKTESRRARSDNAGFDVKLGRGGIREIEFCAQMFQIVRGGRDPVLRERSTPKALRRLAQRRLLDEGTVETLLSAWRLLRRTEHALQYQEDAQTHWLSDDAPQHAAIAAMLGLGHAEFDEQLGEAREAVARVFDELLAPANSAMQASAGTPAGHGAPPAGAAGASAPDSPSAPNTPDAPPAPGATVDAMPAIDDESRRRITAMRDSHAYRKAREHAQQRIEQLLTQALAAPLGPGQCARPELIGRLCSFLESIAGRSAYLELLVQHPAAFDHLLRMMAQARWASDYLRSHPVVIDQLLDGQLMTPIDIPRWAAELREQLDATVLAGVTGDDGQPAPDIERQMDAMREAHHAAVFRLLAQDLERQLTVEHLSDQLSALADAVLEITLERVWRQLPRRHRDDPQFAIIAYGRLGGKELGYSSDLDLVFLYDDPAEDALRIYAQLAQRMSGWLQTRTAAGTLFEVDLRLRPNGNAGLLVSSQQAFSSYQAESAWVWEHQALTRARHCAGNAPIGQHFEQLRRQILARPRERRALVQEILAMRQKMHEGHPNKSGLFDLKHDAGGMVDIEFMVQYLVLAFGHWFAPLLDNRGNIELLRRAGQAGLMSEAQARTVGDAYRRYRQLQHEMRLNDAERARVPHALVAAEAGAVRELWQQLFDARPDH